MKLKAGAYTLIAIILIALFSIFYTISTVEEMESRLLPILLGAIVLFLAVLGLYQEIRQEREPEKAGGKKEKGAAKESWSRSLVNLGWTVIFFVGILLVGYVLAIAIFVFAYMKWLGTRWSTAIVWAVAASLIVYFAFEVGLQLALYRGLLLTWLMG